MLFTRHMATEAAQTTTTTTTPLPTPQHDFCTLLLCPSPALTSLANTPPPPVRLNDRKTKTLRTAFAVYPTTTVAGTQTLAPPPVNVLQSLHEAQIKKMDPSGARTALFAKTREAAKVGDVLMVTHRRGGEPFAGVCLSIRRRGIDTAILLRNHLGKVGVEMWFKIYNKNVAGVEIVKRRPKRARRARLTYMRKPNHDMGSVEDLVFAWKRSRRVFSSGRATAAGAARAKGAAAKKK
jgi:ribosomal protein L19